MSEKIPEYIISLFERWLKFYPNSRISDTDLLVDTVKIVNDAKIGRRTLWPENQKANEIEIKDS
jgi:hypothetical protein